MTSMQGLKSVSTELETLKANWEDTLRRHNVHIDSSALTNMDKDIREISNVVKE